MKKRVSRIARYLVAVITIVVAIMVGQWAFGQWNARRSAAQEAPRPQQRPAPTVRTTVVSPAPLVEQALFPGEVRASATADITARVAGRLGRLRIREGSFVSAGSVVGSIDDPELAHSLRQAEAAVDVQRARLAQLKAGPRSQEVAKAEADLAQAQTTLAQAERELARSQQLFADGLVARAVVDRNQTDVEIARQRVRAAQEQLALVKQGVRQEDIDAQAALVRQAEAQALQIRARQNELRITSPISGVVTRLNIEAGSVVSTQTPIASVATIRPVEVHIPLPETDMGRLRATSRVRIQLDAIPNRVFEGKIARMAPALDTASRSARLVVVVPNGDLALRPGMFARATVVFDERQAIVIPTDAIVRRGDATVVFVVKNDAVDERAVKTGYAEGSRSEIVEGLKPGEAIVVLGQQGLRDGMKVRTAAPNQRSQP